MRIILGHTLDVLKTLPDKSAQCCVTSPPYWGLRDYGLPPQIWGGDPECDHEWTTESIRPAHPDRSTGGKDGNGSGVFVDYIPRGSQDAKNQRGSAISNGCFCKCGSWKGSFGLEPSPKLYIQHTVEIFREVWRVLRDDGTLWLNLGDSYSHSGTGVNAVAKPKNLLAIPWRVALALQDDGWYLRSDIVWHKTNPMPESVKDRPTKSHEYIFLLSKSRKYYYDTASVKEPTTGNAHDRGSGVNPKAANWKTPEGGREKGQYRPKQNESFAAACNKIVLSRNLRSVWTIATQPYKGAHFATFPEKLISPCIKAGCPRHGIVLDPFAGSGTTGVVAKKLGRNYILIELNPKYITMARERIRDAD